MSVSFWIVLGIVLILCCYLFTKTVSNDAENDIKLRDILSNPVSGTGLKKEDNDFSKNEAKGFEFKNKQTEPIIKTSEMKNGDYTKAELETYSTTAHSYSNNNTGADIIESSSQKSPQEESYYQKDRCMVTDKVEEDEPELVINKKIYKTVTETTSDTEGLFKEKEHVVTSQKRGYLYYIKIFWKGMTFALGIPACLYGLHMLFSGADSLVASVWVLIGVILIK